MKIIYKLTLGHLIVSLLVIVVAVFGINTIDKISSTHNELVEQTLPAIEALEDVKAAGLGIAGSTSELVLIRAESKLNVTALDEVEKEHIESGIKQYDTAILRYEEIVNKFFPEEKDFLENIKSSGKKLQKTSAELLALKEQGASGLIVMEKWEEFETAEQEFLKAVNDATTYEDKEIAQRHQNVNYAIAAALRTILITGLLTFAVAIILGVNISSSISKPILKLKNAAVEFGKGRLDTRVDVKSKDEVGILAACFNQMAGRLEQDIEERKRAEEMRLENLRLESAINAQKEFLSRMSHELRTPLNAVIGFSELMKMGKELDEKQEQYINNIHEGGKQLLSIISEILDLSQMESGKIELAIETFSVPEAIDESLVFMKDKAVQRNIILKKEIAPRLELIEADKLRFRQILLNLLDNAIKFSKPEGGTVTIAAKKIGDMAQFSVSDTGTGIKEKDMGKLFEKFWQTDSGTARKYGGLGLGLAVSKQLVELHGGNIRAESKFGKGSVFIFTLPLKAMKEKK